MKVRFLREQLTAYIASQINVESVAELIDAIRIEKNLPPDFVIDEVTLITSPAKETDPGLIPTYQIYVPEIGLIGFCNGPLSSIQEKSKTPLPQGPYFIDVDRAEHRCCWNSAIVRQRTEQEKKEGQERPARILECRKENAKEIRDALNFYHTHRSKLGNENT